MCHNGNCWLIIPQIFIGVPDIQSRRELIHHFLIDIRHSLSDNDVDSICSRLQGWSGSEIEVEHMKNLLL